MSEIKYELVRYWRSLGLSLDEIIEKCKIHGITSSVGTTPGKSTINDWIHGRTIKSQGADSVDQPEDLFSSSKNGIQVLSLDKRDENLDLILAWHLDGYTPSEIAVKCNEHGFVNSKGNTPSTSNAHYWVKKASERLEPREESYPSQSDLLELVCKLVEAHCALSAEVRELKAEVEPITDFFKNTF